MQCLSFPANASFHDFFRNVQEEPSDVSTVVDVLAHTEAYGKKADRLQLDVDPKLLVSSKSRGPAAQRHIPTHAPPKRKVCLHHASYTGPELPDYLHTLTLSAETLCVSTASTGDGEGWRKTTLNKLSLFRRPLHARLGPGRGVKVPCLFVSQIFLDIS